MGCHKRYILKPVLHIFSFFFCVGSEMAKQLALGRFILFFTKEANTNSNKNYMAPNYSLDRVILHWVLNKNGNIHTEHLNQTLMKLSYVHVYFSLSVKY